MNRTTLITLFFILIIAGLLLWKYKPQKPAATTSVIQTNITQYYNNNLQSLSTNSEIKQPVKSTSDLVVTAPTAAVTNKHDNSPFVKGELILRVSKRTTLKKLESALKEKNIRIRRIFH